MIVVKKTSRILIPLAIIIVFIFLVFFGYNNASDIFDEYPDLKKHEPIYETIISVGDYKSTTLIKTKSGKSYGLPAYNRAKKRNELYYYLEVGDSLVHEPGSRLLYLYKKETGEKIRFELDFLED